jgi:hypothetical protein
MLKYFKREGKYNGFTLECETKLIDFYKKFQAVKVDTFPSQFQDFEGLFYLMFIPMITIEESSELNELAVESFKNVKTKLEQVVDHSTDKVLIWRPRNHVSFREVKLDEPEGEELFERGIKPFEMNNETKESIFKKLGTKLRMFLILKDEEVLSSSIIGVLKEHSYCHIEYFYLKESNNNTEYFQKLIGYLSKSYDILTIEFDKDLISLYKKINKIDKLIHSKFFKYKKENGFLEVRFGSKNIHLKKDELIKIMKENQKDQKIVKNTRTQLLKHLLSLKHKK